MGGSWGVKDASKCLRTLWDRLNTLYIDTVCNVPGTRVREDN